MSPEVLWRVEDESVACAPRWVRSAGGSTPGNGKIGSGKSGVLRETAGE